MSEEKYIKLSTLARLSCEGASFLSACDQNSKTLAELNAEAAKPVPVDMEALVGLECVFFSGESLPKHPFFACLKEVVGGGYETEQGGFWSRCRPRPDYWYYWRNFGSSTALIDKKHRLEAAGFELVRPNNINGATEAFQIKGPAEGRCWREDADNA